MPFQKGNQYYLITGFIKGRTPWNKGMPKEKQPNFGKHCSEETKKKLSLANKGSPSWAKGKLFSIKHRQNMSFSKMAEKNPMWVGNKITCGPLHKWVKSRISKPKFCEDCKKVPPYDLANKGIYTRELNQWEWLCRRCHMLSDGRMSNLKQFQVLVKMSNYARN